LAQFKGTKKLTDLCREMRLEEFEEKNAIIREGELGEKFYIIYSGKVAVYKNTKVQDNYLDKGFTLVARQLCELGSGDSFGEVALMNDAPRSASVIATELT
jgi:CRP-like cAMP-binding protein